MIPIFEKLAVRWNKAYRLRKAQELFAWLSDERSTGVQRDFGLTPELIDRQGSTLQIIYRTGLVNGNGRLKTAQENYTKLAQFLSYCRGISVRRPNPLVGLPGREGRATWEVHEVTGEMTGHIFGMVLAIELYRNAIIANPSYSQAVVEATNNLANAADDKTSEKIYLYLGVMTGAWERN